MPFQWDEATERLMLLAVIHVAAPAPPKWDEVAKLVGNGLTGNAIRKKYEKLRSETKEKFGESAVTTPKKATPKKATATPASGRKRKTAKDSSNDAEDGEAQAAAEDDQESPAKKVKTEAQDDFV